VNSQGVSVQTSSGHPERTRRMTLVHIIYGSTTLTMTGLLSCLSVHVEKITPNPDK
jgi:hypothetical protein